MPVVAQTYPTLGDLVVFEDDSDIGWCREGLTVNETVDTQYGVGYVLGKVTTTGKYKLCNPSAADGSQTAVAVVAWDNNGDANDYTVKAVTDTKLVAFVRGSLIFRKNALRFGAGFTTQLQKDTAVAQLALSNPPMLTTVTV